MVRFLNQPRHYPHAVRGVAHRETHISHVFLAGNFAYKLKKPVRFSFLDASTLALRRKWCRSELKLNRRLAPDLYLGIVPVVETHRGLRLGRGAPAPRHFLGSEDGAASVSRRGRVVEWLVKMSRLPEERMLDRLIERGKATPQDARRVADCLIRFFKQTSRSRRIDRFGAPERVAKLVLQNLQECRPFAGRLVSRKDLDFVERAFRQFLLLREPFLRRRVTERRVIDGHGDLRCENICLTDPVTVFDCVEFEPAFRCGDTANDLAFLLMDLEFRGRPDLARAVLERYRRTAHDPAVEKVLPFYQCYRSLVRGKVRALAWLQHPRTRRGRQLRGMAFRHFDLARRYAEQFHRPLLLAVGGTIGTGKSTLARQLCAGSGAVWLRTDEIRLKEFRRFRRSGQGFSEGLYAPHVSGLVYRRLIQRARALLRDGRSVVCDGTFSKAAGRQELRELARKQGAIFHFFECTVPRRIALKRVGVRFSRRSDLSEARPEFYDRMKAQFEPERRLPAKERTLLSTAASPADTFQKAVKALQGG